MTELDNSALDLQTQRSDEAMLLDYLRDHDAACPVCKYNLRALSVPRCPECGRALKLSIGTLDPYLTAWIMLAIATFGSSGIAILLDAFFIIKIGVYGSGFSFHGMEIVAWWSFNISIPLAIATLCFRRTFAKLPTTLQWVLASAATILAITEISMFVVFMK